MGQYLNGFAYLHKNVTFVKFFSLAKSLLWFFSIAIEAQNRVGKIVRNEQ